MGYIGNTPALKYASFAVQHFTTSATTTYSLDNPVANENEIALFINNVRQEPGSSFAYTASGTTLTLSAATSASDTMYCVFIGKAVQTVTPASGSVTNDMLAGSIANSKLANSSITLNGSAVSLGGSASVSGGFDSALLHVRDEKSQNTSGGASSSGTQTRTLNTVKTNEITGASLSSNQITLPSGTYYIDANIPCVGGDLNQAYLYSVTDGSNEIIGNSTRSNMQPDPQIHGRFTTNIQRVYEIRHYIQTSNSSGLGIAVNQTTEVYTDVRIWKVA